MSHAQLEPAAVWSSAAQRRAGVAPGSRIPRLGMGTGKTGTEPEDEKKEKREKEDKVAKIA